MKLYNILYSAGFICFMLGTAGVDGWLVNGTSLLIPLVLLAVSLSCWYLGCREDGKIRNRRNKKNVFNEWIIRAYGSVEKTERRSR